MCGGFAWTKEGGVDVEERLLLKKSRRQLQCEWRVGNKTTKRMQFSIKTLLSWTLTMPEGGEELAQLTFIVYDNFGYWVRDGKGKLVISQRPFAGGEELAKPETKGEVTIKSYGPTARAFVNTLTLQHNDFWPKRNLEVDAARAFPDLAARQRASEAAEDGRAIKGG